MAEDYYADAASDKTEETPSSEPKEGASDSQVGELPLSVFPDPPKVGDKCEFEVVQVSEGSAVVRYASATPEQDKADTETPEPAPAPSGGPMTPMLG